jgi:hypothetical protein
MPAEAVHLSALDDSLAASPARAALRRHAREARLGAVFVDLPYFDHFALAVVRYLLKRPVTSSAWGAEFHLGRPVALGKALLRRAASLRAEPSSREDGERLAAFGLGYFSHLAVDTALHPLVNRLARERAGRLGDRAARQHTEVEKFQSILFHERRFGFDFMGRPELAAHVGVDGRALLGPGRLGREVLGAVHDALERAPSARLLGRWLAGYRQYVWLISGPAGKTILPPAAKEAVREEAYEACRFEAQYDDAVARSARYLGAAFAFAEAPREAGLEAALDAVAPEGPIDEA